MFMIRTRTRTNYYSLAQPPWGFPAREVWDPQPYLAQPLAPYPDRYRSNIACTLLTSVMPSAYGIVQLQKAMSLH